MGHIPVPRSGMGHWKAEPLQSFPIKRRVLAFLLLGRVRRSLRLYSRSSGRLPNDNIILRRGMIEGKQQAKLDPLLNSFNVANNAFTRNDRDVYGAYQV